MATLELGKSRKNKYLEVHVEGRKKVYKLPLANHLNVGDSMMLRAAAKAPKKKREEAFFDAFYQICCKYIDKAIIDGLSLDDLETLAAAWNEQSGREESLGE